MCHDLRILIKYSFDINSELRNNIIYIKEHDMRQRFAVYTRATQQHYVTYLFSFDSCDTAFLNNEK